MPFRHNPAEFLAKIKTPEGVLPLPNHPFQQHLPDDHRCSETGDSSRAVPERLTSAMGFNILTKV